MSGGENVPGGDSEEMTDVNPLGTDFSCYNIILFMHYLIFIILTE